MTRRALLGLLVLLMPALGRSQEGGAPDLVPGTRVRVTAAASGPKPLTGTIRALSDEAITLAVEGRDMEVAVFRDGIVRLEVSEGRNRRKGLLIGGVAVATVGALIGGVGCRDSSDFDSWHCATILGGLGFAAGAGVGAIVGAGDRWRDVPPDGFRVTLAPTAGGRPGLSVRLAF
jgi:hypothetical protein